MTVWLLIHILNACKEGYAHNKQRLEKVEVSNFDELDRIIQRYGSEGLGTGWKYVVAQVILPSPPQK